MIFLRFRILLYWKHFDKNERSLIVSTFLDNSSNLPFNSMNHRICCHSWFRTTDSFGSNGTSFIISTKYVSCIFCLLHDIDMFDDWIYLPNILETHPFETWRILEMSHGLAPLWANSTIFCRVASGRGRPVCLII